MVIKPNVLSARGVKGLACNIVRTDYMKWKWRLQTNDWLNYFNNALF